MTEPLATADELHALASQVTGLSDFGPDDYTDGLGVLLGSLERDADLTPRGRKVMRAMLRGALAARLLSEAGWEAHPEYEQVLLDRPLFVTGLPRTGTTALHRLLNADPTPYDELADAVLREPIGHVLPGLVAEALAAC